MGDLDDVYRDDRLIEAAARGEHLDAADPAAGVLLALSQVADAGPLPRLDLDPVAWADPHHNRRYAVRSLAVAVAVVATLSTSGVAAVVTGDPFGPAKAVWDEIQEHTRHRVHVQGQGPAAGSAGATARSTGPSGPSRPSASSVPAASGRLSPLTSQRSGASLQEQGERAVDGSETGAAGVAAAAARPAHADSDGAQWQGTPQQEVGQQETGQQEAGQQEAGQQGAAQQGAREQDPDRPRPEQGQADSSADEDASGGAEDRSDDPAYPSPPPTPGDDGSASPEQPAEEEADEDDGRRERRTGPVEGDEADLADQADEGAIDVPLRRREQSPDDAAPGSEQRQRAGERGRDGVRRLARMGASPAPPRPDRASPSHRESSTDREEVPWN